MIVSVLSKVYRPMINMPASKGHGLSAALADEIDKESGGGSSLPSKPKPPGNLKPSSKEFLPGTTPYAYKPKRDERCRRGYKSVIKSGRRMCVKIDG